MKQLAAVISLLLIQISYAQAEFVIEDATAVGVTNPSDASWRSYREQMDRFPDRLGFICYNAYILNKTPDHLAAINFFKECARRGHAPSMINLSQFYADGVGVAVDRREAAYWIRRAAETGYGAGELEYAKLLFKGDGVTRNTDLAEFWLRRARAHGDPDAAALLAIEPSPQISLKN